jgi:hypothetical protein
MTSQEIKNNDDYIKYKKFIPNYWLENDSKQNIILNYIEFLKDFNIKPRCSKPFNNRYEKAVDYCKLKNIYGDAIDHYRFYTDNENHIIFVNSPYQDDNAEWGKKKEETLKNIGFTRYKKPIYNERAVTYYIKIPANKKFNF